MRSLPELLEGVPITLLLTFCAISAGFALGLLLALGRVYGKKGISYSCIAYLEIFRGTPLLVQLFIIYYGLPNIGIIFSPLLAALLGLSLNSAAYQAEYLRGSIQAIPANQMIAGRTLGMTRFQSIRTIILPQALRISIPAWSNELIYLLKYTSIVVYIQVRDLTFQAKDIAAQSSRYLETFLVVALIYLLFTILFSEIVDRVEKRVRIPGVGLSPRIVKRNMKIPFKT
ncbi:MAG: amino acid ABC transporter permease [Candidatus Thermoplasmatota archaeon]|nr:amino acid ABC transporter permease [Candidatus Thermoplasmatota archaeon]